MAEESQSERVVPPQDITPHDFFVHYIGDAVARDPSRRDKLGTTEASIVFQLAGSSDDPGGDFTVRIEEGTVTGTPGAVGDRQTCERGPARVARRDA